jgi:hypothetical protein
MALCYKIFSVEAFWNYVKYSVWNQVHQGTVVVITRPRVTTCESSIFIGGS